MFEAIERHEPRSRVFVYDFTDGRADMADLLGGKAAILAEMAWLGLPVPPGYTVSTEACRAYLRSGLMPMGLPEQIDAHLARLEEQAGRRLGNPDEPLLISVRSGARFSMPGVMETILNIGVCDATVDGLAKLYGDERFAWDCYRRLAQVYGRTVFHVAGDVYERALAEAKEHAGADATAPDSILGVDGMRALTRRFLQLTHEHSGRELPQKPREQLLGAVRAVFESWNGERARIYRQRERIPEGLGTAVIVMQMVFGNLGPDSGTGVARIAAQLEAHYRDMCDLELTVERGRLWMLQTSVPAS